MKNVVSLPVPPPGRQSAGKANASLGTLEVVTLSLLTVADRTGYDIRKWLDQYGTYVGYTAQTSQIYRQLGKMVERGWATSRPDPRSTGPDAKLYSITGPGGDVLAAWVDSPYVPSRRPLDPDFQLRLRFGAPTPQRAPWSWSARSSPSAVSRSRSGSSTTTSSCPGRERAAAAVGRGVGDDAVRARPLHGPRPARLAGGRRDPARGDDRQAAMSRIPAPDRHKGGHCCQPSRSTAPTRLGDSAVTVASGAPVEHADRPIPAGEFLMGDAFDEGYRSDGETPIHAVRLSGFRVDAHQVTNAQFRRFVTATGYRTEAERFASSAVFHLLVRAHTPTSWAPPPAHRGG